MEENFIIQDSETLKALADPLRMEILRLLKTPKTVKEIGQALHKHPTKLYYHVNMLEKCGVILVVETNVVSGIIEKKYQLAARNFQIRDGLLSDNEAIDDNTDAFLQTIFGMTQAEVKNSIRAEQLTPSNEKNEQYGLLFRSQLTLTEAQFLLYQNKFESLLKELDEVSHHNDEHSDSMKPFAITLAYYPVTKLDET